MARLPRLAIPGFAHLATLRAHGGRELCADDVDRAELLAAMRDALPPGRVDLHAYALLSNQIWLLVTPISAADLSRSLQGLARRFTVFFNRRHDHRGTVWDGRYRCTVLEPGQRVCDAMLFIDQAAVGAGLASEAAGWRWSSAAHHLGAARDPLLVDAKEYWALGNTPFDRAEAYAVMLRDVLTPARARELSEAAAKGWAIGSADFLEALRASTARPVSPRRRGRPTGKRLSVPN